MFWLGAVGIPYLALLALAIIESGPWESRARKFIEVGIDLCILGIGVCGALFASDQVRTKIGEGTTTIAVALILVDLAITGMCFRLRSGEETTESLRAFFSIVLGLLILGVNTIIVVAYS